MSDRDLRDAPWGVYLHVPWCRRRCPYCAFYVEVDRGNRDEPSAAPSDAVPWDPFVDRIVSEYRSRAPAFAGPARTLFLGGGTPSRMPGPALKRLIAAFALVPGAEITAEVNPEDADARWLAEARDAGVNRVSIGVQTFDPQFARLLNRACTVDEARQTAARVASAGFRSWSIDVIFGLPGQTKADLDADLDRLLATEPPHVSLYGLTIEPGTAFERAFARGKLVPADGDLWRTLYDRLVERLAAVGIHRYEVSNFARDGHRSEHNRLYWTDAPYLGLGPSAHGYLPDGRRYANIANVGRYLAIDDPTETIETPSPRERALDLLISSLRYVEGLSLEHLARRTGLRPDDRTVRAMVRGRLLIEDPFVLRLTDDGFAVADGIAAKLADALVSARNPAMEANLPPGD